MNFNAGSLVIGLAGSLLLHFGFSEQCSSEMTQLVPVIVGNLFAYLHNVKMGVHTLGGLSVKK